MSKVIAKSSLVVLKEKSLIIETFDGMLTLDISKKHKLKQLQQEPFIADYNTLADYSSIEFRMSLEQVKEYREYYLEISKQHNKKDILKKKSAVIVNKVNHLIYLNEFKNQLKKFTDQKISFCTSYDEAMKWMGILDDREEILAIIEKCHKNPMFEWKMDSNDEMYL